MGREAVGSSSHCPKAWVGTPPARAFGFMIPEAGSQRAFKTCLLATVDGLPVAGYVYRIPDWVKPVAVIDVDRHWVHIITTDLKSSTSYELEAWYQGAAAGRIQRTNEPWRDLEELRQMLFGG